MGGQINVRHHDPVEPTDGGHGLLVLLVLLLRVSIGIGMLSIVVVRFGVALVALPIDVLLTRGGARYPRQGLSR